jgi:putative transposase
MYRLQRELSESGERRQQKPAQHYAIPLLVATRPHVVWTWDITKLALIRRGVYLSLYVVLDLFSRYIVSWMLSHKENSALAKLLMYETVERYQIAPGQTYFISRPWLSNDRSWIS